MPTNTAVTPIESHRLQPSMALNMTAALTKITPTVPTMKKVQIIANVVRTWALYLRPRYSGTV